MKVKLKVEFGVYAVYFDIWELTCFACYFMILVSIAELIRV